jgi:uncharacterized small protein (TIGR04563 family)
VRFDSSGIQQQVRIPASIPDDAARGAGQKLNLYLPVWMAREVAREAARLDRSVSWILRRAWKLARMELRAARAKTPRRATFSAGGGSPPRVPRPLPAGHPGKRRLPTHFAATGAAGGAAQTTPVRSA